jgi:hypothetical protein
MTEDAMKPTVRSPTGPLPRRPAGQTITEYTLICLVLAAALFAPVPGAQQSVGEMVAGKLKDLYADLTFFISLP